MSEQQPPWDPFSRQDPRQGQGQPQYPPPQGPYIQPPYARGQPPYPDQQQPGWPQQQPGWLPQQPYMPPPQGPQPPGHRAPRQPRSYKGRNALIGIATLIGIIVAISVATGHSSSSSGNNAATSVAASTPTAAPAPPPLTCSTVTNDNSMTAMQVIATLVQDQKSQDASEEQNWVGLTDGSQTSQGDDLAAAASALGSYADTQVAADGSTFATDANTFLTDQSGGLIPGWISEYRAVQNDIAKLAADCGVSYTLPAGE